MQPSQKQSTTLKHLPILTWLWIHSVDSAEERKISKIKSKFYILNDHQESTRQRAFCFSSKYWSWRVILTIENGSVLRLRVTAESELLNTFHYVIPQCRLLLLFLMSSSLSREGNCGRLTRVRHSGRKSRTIHSYQWVKHFRVSRPVVWLAVFGIFNVRTDVEECDCTRVLYGHRRRVCTETWLWEKNILPHRGLEPATVLRLAFQRNAVAAELFPRERDFVA